MELPLHGSLPVPNIANLLHPPPELQKLITDAQFKAFAYDLLTTPVNQDLIRKVLDVLLNTIPASLPITADISLMLDEKVLQAVRDGKFHVYAVRQADEALSLLVWFVLKHHKSQ